MNYELKEIRKEAKDLGLSTKLTIEKDSQDHYTITGGGYSSWNPLIDSTWFESVTEARTEAIKELISRHWEESN